MGKNIQMPVVQAQMKSPYSFIQCWLENVTETEATGFVQLLMKNHEKKPEKENLGIC